MRHSTLPHLKVSLAVGLVLSVVVAALGSTIQPVAASPLFTIFTIQPDATAGIDTTLYSDLTSTNFGTDTALDALCSTSERRRALVQFDVSSIPSGSHVVSATLEFTARASVVGEAVDIYRMTVGWTETGATWNKYDGSSNWSTAGGDFTSSGFADPTVPSTSNGDKVDLPVQDIVQAWVNGASNFCFIVLVHN